MTLLHPSTCPKSRPSFYAQTLYRGSWFTGYDSSCPWLAAWNSVRAAMVWFQTERKET